MNIDFAQKVRKCLVLFMYTYVWYQAMPYDCTNIASIWPQCNDLIHSIHREIYKIVYTLIIYNLC